jgi:hypothetical protein
MGLADRGWAARVLGWEYRPPLLVAEVARARYLLRVDPHEVIAWCELRDVSGGRRADVGSFRDVVAAKAACEQHAAARCRRDDADECPPVSVAIAPGRRRRSTVGHPPVTTSTGKDAGDIDAALAAWADVIANEG